VPVCFGIAVNAPIIEFPASAIRGLIWLAVLILFAFDSAAAQARGAERADPVLAPLVSQYCVSCHDAEVKKGVTPVADNEIAVIEMENAAAYGTIIPKVPTARSVRSAT